MEEARTSVGCVEITQTKLSKWHAKHKEHIRVTIWSTIIIAFSGYVGYCMYFDLNNSIALVVLSCLLLVACAYYVIKDKAGDKVSGVWEEEWSLTAHKWWRYGKWLWWAALLAGFIVIIALDLKNRPDQLIAIAGIGFFIIVCFLMSTDPSNIDWGITMKGVACQVVLALIVLRWEPGAVALEWISNRIVGFLNYAQTGAKFVFGELNYLHPFAMEVAPVLCYFTACINLLCYWGVMQIIIEVLGSLFQFFIGSSKVEAFVAIAAVFLGPDVPAIMIRSMIPLLTTSQMLTLLTSSMSTLDAGMFPVYESMGIPASHLVASSLISAPATIVVSKLLIPEKAENKHKSEKLKIETIEATNSVDAFAKGAVMSIPIVGTMLAMLIAFVSLLEFVNTFLTWMGHRAGLEELTLELIFGYVFAPVAFLLGVPWGDCVIVGQLFGIKTIINEYVAYVELGTLINNRISGLEPQITERSETIASYALSGYSNIGTVGWMVGFMSILAPSKRGEISGMAVKSLFSSTVACFMTAAVAGLLYQGG